MFDFVRKHTRVMQFLLFILIVPSFVLFGVEGYNSMSDKGAVVATVDGQEITQSEWDAAHKAEVDRMRQQMPTLDAKLFDSPAAKFGALERLVRERVLAAAAEQARLFVSDARVARELQGNELIAALRGADGKLDMDRYRQMLAQQGMSPEVFENSVRAELATRQVLGAVAQSAFVTPTVAGVALGNYFERREVRVARFAPADFQARVEPTDAQIEAYYKANPQQFQAPEQANVEYVVLDLAAVQGGIALPEQDLRTYFEQNAARLSGGQQEERRASHILIAVPKGASAADKDQAKARAGELLAQVRKAPDSFAEVAKKNSQDPGSAPQGGDLDFFSRGAMTKAFEDAAFGLKQKGQISDVVETEFGFHIIRLTDMKVPKTRTFEEVRPEIEAQLRGEQAQRKYAEAADAFSNGVYEQSDSLKPVAEKLKLEVRSASGITRTPQPGATGPLANPKFLQALFGPDSVERTRNTEALEIGPNQMVSGRITQYTPARTRPLAEVRAQVRERVVAERAAELARKEGQERLAAWKADPAAAAAALPAAVPLSRQDAGKQPPPVIEAALRADAAALPALLGVDLGAEGYAVVQVVKVLPREVPSPQQAQQEREQYLRAWSMAESVAYYNLLKERFKVKLEVAQPKNDLLQ
ncbi:MAG: Rotamase [Ramlibacter sp.]|uniref:SurA N-terminal domain-containing protein n=1 Tax=Ramlibacter sp. TaxID=1917967 RepID=UPI0026292418|nr:SurA N-terminal domain-containing protein [Ramlibacter sp.]MDB5750960.1 Rotamase [Ramlibacter sp.]